MAISNTELLKEKKYLEFTSNLIKESNSDKFNKDLVIIPSYLAKGLEFDSVISYNDKENKYTKLEKYLFYVVLTRAQHELIVYNN